MIGMIAAIGKNNELGKDNKLIWSIPNDMKFFKKTTMGHKVIMGMNTYRSLPSSGLPGREMIVLSRTKREDTDEVKFVTNILEIVSKYGDSSEEVLIIGGASIYREFLPYCRYMYLTEINMECLNADAFFPNFDKGNWDFSLLEEGISNNVNYKIKKYVRKK